MSERSGACICSSGRAATIRNSDAHRAKKIEAQTSCAATQTMIGDRRLSSEVMLELVKQDSRLLLRDEMAAIT